MGNSNSSIYIKLPSTAYFAGEIISGEVCLSLKHSLACENLVLEFLGCEETFWEEFSEKEFSKIATNKGYEVISQNSIVLYKCVDKKIRHGSYSFPFVIRLPDNIPGSFSYSSKMVQSSTKYIISACLDSIPEPIFGKQEIRLIQTPSEQIANLSSAAMSQPIRWCCFKQGNIFMRANANKPAYLMGEKIEINLEIYSEMRFSNALVESVLYKKVTLRSDNRQTKIIKDRISQEGIHLSIGPNVRKEPRSIKFSFRLDKGFVEQEINESFSTKGNLISCSYLVVSTVYLNSAVYHPNPHVTVFVNILPKTKRQIHPEISNWNPVKMQSVTLQPSAPSIE